MRLSHHRHLTDVRHHAKSFWMARLLSIVMAATLVSSICVQAETQRVAELTDRERVARRLAPEDARYRREIAVAEGRTGRDGDGYLVDGARNPELLMAWEIMAHVIGAFERDGAVLAGKAERWRARGAAAHLRSEDFLPRLAEITRKVVDANVELSRIDAQLAAVNVSDREAAQRRRAEVNRSLCGLQADALAAGRTAFGAENFQRFLYEAVAPDVIVSTSAGSSPEATADLWQWYERGCR